MVVFDRAGHILRSWGEHLLKRPRAVHLAPDLTTGNADPDLNATG